MSYLYKELIDTKKPNLKIRITLTFNRDTTHWATNKSKEVGYQVVVTPTEVIDKGDYQVTTTSAFSGFYEIIYPVGRQSSKRLLEALNRIQDNKERYINYFKDKGIEI